MSDSENQPKDDNNNNEEKNKDDAVLTQIGEDPGLPADAIEQEDSKAVAPKENKQGKGTDFTKTKE
jgi:hypothetical protein